jgi:hypothetical protein
MFTFRAGEWDAALSSRCNGDGASQEIAYVRETRRAERHLFLFARVITYKLPDSSKAELEVIVASTRLWPPASLDEAGGWKVVSLGLGLILALRLSVHPQG